MDGIDYKHVQADILDPSACILRQEDEEPGGDDQNVCHHCPNDPILRIACRPLYVRDVPEGRTYAKDTSNPRK